MLFYLIGTTTPPSHRTPVDMVDKIPVETIARILQISSFQHYSTKITAETLMMLQDYMEILVREAVLRSIANKEEAEQEGLNRNMQHARLKHENEGMLLTHRDLERIAGLLLLDM